MPSFPPPPFPPRRLAAKPRSPRIAALTLALPAIAAAAAAAATLAAPALAQESPPAAQPAPAQQTAPPGQTSTPRGPGGGALVTQPAPQQAAPTGKPTPPRALNFTPPEYPPAAKAAGLEGSVTLQLDIDRNGKVLQAVVIEGAGNGFDEAAVAAAKKLDFEPARRADGTPSAARILYRYTFTLQPSPSSPPAPPGPGAAPQSAAPREQISGMVLGEGEIPLAGATVTITFPDGARPPRNITTDETGAFVFPDLPPGRYRVTIAAPGFQPLEVNEEIAAGEQVEVKYRLLAEGDGLEVVIRGERPPREVTKRTLEQREISRIPGTNGDAIRSIQNLPGVARPPSIAGLLIVRGSAPQDTQTFIDGTNVPLIYHFGGLSSVVPTEMLDKIDFYPGNFSAQYGRVMGGIVDVSLRSPRDDALHGLAQVDFIDARVMLEGPVPYLDGVRFAIAGRRSYIDAWAGPALEAAGAGVTQAPVYYDYQALVEADLGADARIRLAFMGSDDALELLVNEGSPQEPALTGNVGLHTAFKRLQLRYDHELTDKDRLGGVIALGHDDADFALGPLYFLLDNDTLSGRLEYSRRVSQGVTFNAGLDMLAGTYEVKLRTPALPRPGQPPNGPFSTRTFQEVAVDGTFYRPAAYVELELAPTARARIVPGLRLDYQKDNEEFVASPRVNARYDIVQGYPRTTAKAGLGVYTQPPQFQESIPPLGSPGLRSNQALHYALGMEQELTRNLEVSAEGFYKQLDSLVVGATNPAGGNATYVNSGTGKVMGGEFLLKYKPDERFFGWAAYTLSRSTRIDAPGEPERLVSFDQTHILTVLGSYQLGHGWEFGARFRLVSGNLVTPNVCNASDFSCDPDRANALFHAPSGAYTPIPLSGRASERLPLFHQLDLRVDKRWKFKSWQLSAYLDVQNVYNNANTEGILYNFNYTARQYVSGLPLLPSFGLRGEF